jgi:hypothetical protein
MKEFIRDNETPCIKCFYQTLVQLLLSRASLPIAAICRIAMLERSRSVLIESAK